MKKRIIPVIMAAVLAVGGLPITAKADSSKVVTLGANLSEEQKASMYEYFGTTADEADTIEVTNKDERKYMEGIASEAQIGTRTFSCSYVEPTSDGGIQVKVANLTFVTSSMIASTLLTSGVENCNVVAASPIEVSGTGALTGIMMAYESASGEELSEEQKAAATEELVTTGELAEDIGQQEASDLMNQVKQEVIEDGLTDEGEIENAIIKAADKTGVTLTEDQINQILSLMQNIAQYDYDVKALKETLDNLEGKEEGFFSKLVSSITGIFGGDEGGIINNTNDSVLGDSAVIDSTLGEIRKEADSEEGKGFFSKIVDFFKGLFGEEDEATDEENPSSDDASTPDAQSVDEESAGNGSDSSDDPEAPIDSEDPSDNRDSSSEDPSSEDLDDNATTDTFDTSDGTIEEVQ